MPGNFAPPADLWYDASYADGDGSYYKTACAYAGADWAGLFPTGWAAGTGETPEGTCWNNAVEGTWLPLWLPEGFEGGVAGHPSVVMYALNHVPGMLDHLGAAHSSPEVDQARFDQMCHYALEQASGGGSYARENP